MKRGDEDSILFKRLCARFPRIIASFVFPDGSAIKPAAEIYAPMEEPLFPAAKGIRIERGFGRPADHYSTGLRRLRAVMSNRIRPEILMSGYGVRAA
jgi:hypothetical protein